MWFIKLQIAFVALLYISMASSCSSRNTVKKPQIKPPDSSIPSSTVQPTVSKIELKECEWYDETGSKQHSSMDNVTSQTSKNDAINPLVFRNNFITTFIASNRTSETVQQYFWQTPDVHHIAQTTNEFPKTSRIIQASVQFLDTMPSVGFTQTVVDCYRNHHNLVFRPDDIWTALMVQISFYINSEAETLRPMFVDHAEKMKLTGKVNGDSLHSGDYREFVEEIIEKISANLKANITNWVLPNFTTTTPDDKIVNGIVLMSAMQDYFVYEAYVACGIPQITLLGTLEDWEEIFRRAQKLQTFGKVTAKWYALLEPILRKFLDAKRGNVDYDFWSDICRVHSTKGYLGQEEGFLDGWITVFNVFDRKGKWQGNVKPGERWPKIDLENLASGSTNVPITINGDGQIHNATMFAGHMGQSVLNDKHTLQPYSGWAVALN